MKLHDLRLVAARIRRDIVDMTTAAGSGHLTSSLSAVELAVGLFCGGIFRADLARPDHPDNDRLIFSKGHASPLLYALYAAAGIIPRPALLTYRSFHSPLQGHPMPDFPYTEAPTGSLGQGLSIGLGMALAQRIHQRSYRTYVLLGDSETAEGSVWEAAALAGHLKLGSLTAIVDINSLGQRGPTMLKKDAAAYERRFAAFGWNTMIIDGHDLAAVVRAVRQASRSAAPTAILATTVKGKGIPWLEGKNGWHGKALSAAERKRSLDDWPSIGTVPRLAVKKPKAVRVRKPAPVRISELRSIGAISPRQALGEELVRMAARDGRIVALDGEVGNSTFLDLFAKAIPSRFVEGYIAEQNLVGMAVGLAKRGLLPVAATFGAFWTRAADQLRMAGYAGTRQVYIGTHAGVHIGQDGPSQMALEDIALFRNVWGSVVLYPSDGEAAKKLLSVAAKHGGVSYIRATRADLPRLYKGSQPFTLGGSVTLRASRKDRATVIAAGVTVHEALRAADELAKRGTRVRVIDLYSIKPIDETTLRRAARQTKRLIVVEDHLEAGGIGEAVATALGPLAGAVTSLAVRRMPRSGRPEELLRYEGIDATAIVRAVIKVLRA